MQKTMASSGPSIFSVTRSKTRLIVAVVIGPGGRRGRGRGRLGGVLAEKVEVEHLPGDRRRGARAESGVLDQDCERDPGVLHGRKGDEEGVVAQVLGNLSGVRGPFVLLESDDLRRARLSGADVGRSRESACARAFL